MTVGEAAIVMTLVMIGAGFVLCGIAFVVQTIKDRGPSTREREAVEDAPAAVGRARVVASEDLTWQVDLARFYRDYDTYVREQRLPGERAS